MTEESENHTLETRNPENADTEAATQTLMRRVGQRVQRARKLKNMPRRVLSNLSGVSPRYLAQLENGSGNISIALLMRVAAALDHKIEWLLSDEDPATSEAMAVAERFRCADEPLRAEVRRLLDRGTRPSKQVNRFCLIGLRGAGKSTLGRRAGAALNLPFVELNREIEKLGQMPVGEIIALYGPEGYRKLEAEALERVISDHDDMVLAVAGGIVTDRGAYETLLEHCHTIWLRASAGEHMERVRAQGDLRPMEGQREAMGRLRELLAERAEDYGRASHWLDTSGKAEDDSLRELLDLIGGLRSGG